MKETYTSTEARAALHVDAKTFLRWLKQGDIKPQVSKADQRIKLFTQEQVQRLADEHERSLRDEGTLSTDERLAALESRISRLEGMIEGLSSNVPQRSQQATSRPSATSTLPEGLVPLTTFYHGVPETTVRRAMQAGELPVIRGEWKKEGHLVTQALDAAGRRQFIALFSQHPQFKPCDRCPHNLV